MDPAKRTTYIIAALALIGFIIGIYFLFIFQKGEKVNKEEQAPDEIKQISDITIEKRPYVTLTPTTDGAEIILAIENMSAFDKIEYTLTYQADNPEIAGEKIERGSTGFDVNTKDPRYKKSILLGTASKGTRSPDKGVTEGKLSLNLFQGETEYVSETSWDLIEAGLKAQEIKNRSEKLSLEIPSMGKNYFIIIADTVGVPPNSPFEAKNTLLPTMGVFSVAPAFKKSANLTIKIDQENQKNELYSYKTADSKWEKIESEFNSQTKDINASVAAFATYVVVSSQ